MRRQKPFTTLLKGNYYPLSGRAPKFIERIARPPSALLQRDFAPGMLHVDVKRPKHDPKREG